MPERVLITGGAGFIGSHLTDELLQGGYQVRILDNLCEQVHGPDGQRPAYLAPEAELIVGDVRDRSAVQRALAGVDSVVHLAALVGVGQSMYQIRPYTDVNEIGTATLLEALSEKPVRRLVVASSMSIYGEGLYLNHEGQVVEEAARPAQQLREGQWELHDYKGLALRPIPTPENKTPSLSSIYALSKYVQERQCLLIGQAYGIPTVALRFFNVYGTRQALSNPYTGVLAIFASRLLNGNAPMIFEDGRQMRDFVHVADVARACRQSLEADVGNMVFNIGSGKRTTVREVAHQLAHVMGRPEIQPEITLKFRVGDIRHCFADILLAQEYLGFQPQVDFEEGLLELSEWLSGQIAVDRFDAARQELTARGLTV